MKSAIPQDHNARQRLVQKVRLRMFRAANWLDPQRQDAVRFYKIWRKIVDEVESSDEPNIFLGYAFGIVESIVAKTTEPILKLRPPCNVLPLDLGDGRAAANFKDVARNWYAKPNNQEPLYRSKKEMGIVGTRFEVDQWVNQQARGVMWGKEERVVEAPIPDQRKPGQFILGPDGKPVMGRTKVMVESEVKRPVPIHYGFQTRYPRFFDSYPEPDRKTIGTGLPTDCGWFIEDLGEQSLAAMCREMYVDPHDQVTKPVYDFSELLKDAGEAAQRRYKALMDGDVEYDDGLGPLIAPVRQFGDNTDWGRVDKDTVHPSEGDVDRSSSEDMDKVWGVRMHAPGEIITVVQGRYVVQRLIDPFHIPDLSYIRAECYTYDPEFLCGQGILKPISDEIDELNDIHNLSMAQWIRIINKMVAVDVSKVVTMEDFKPRAGGKIRIKEGDVRSAISSIEQVDPTPSMLNQESNTRGLIEFTSGHMDGSPGTRGTKQDHKTKGGLELIQVNLNSRFVTMYRQALVNEARRMMSMSRFFDQFAFEKMPYRQYRDDGSTALAKFNKDDVYTEGRGFEFAIEIDPNFGDTQVQRQEDLYLLDRGYEYERVRRETRDPSMRQLRCDVLMEKVLRDFGHVDQTRLFVAPDQSVTPEDELQVLMQGGTVECKGDLLHHVQMHLLQRESPVLRQAVEAGKADPQTIKRLDLLIEQDVARIRAFAADPIAAAEKLKGLAAPPMGGTNG
jgi:hypothetical protein